MDDVTTRVLAEIAEDARVRLRQQEPGAARIVEQRYPELLDTLDWYVERGEPDAAYRLASSLVQFWISTNRIGDGDDWFGKTLAHPLGSDESRARALYDHGYLIFWAGGYDLAVTRFTQSRDIAVSLADPTLIALTLSGLARVALNTDIDEAIRLLREAVLVTQGLDDGDEGRSSALHVLGVALQMSGDLEGAREVMSRRLALGRARSDMFIVWVESANLSMVERRLGNLEAAEQLARQVLRIDAGRGDEMSIAWSLNGLAAVAAAKGDLERAATLAGMAAAMLHGAGGEWPPDERQQYEETLTEITSGLSPGVIQRARAYGAAMSIDAAVAYASADG